MGIDGKSLQVNAIPMRQPMGDFYVAVFNYEQLISISYSDIRSMENDLDTYIGIQRKINPQRVKEIAKFTNTIDATFPTSIVIAVSGSCAHYDEEHGLLVIHETDDTEYASIAKILDGQHRIEGLKGYENGQFDLSVTVFIEADIADQAYIFATVNLAQTKVNRSLVYDLLDYSKSRSPQKTCHEVAVGLDRYEESPFYQMIKRLGSTTPGRTRETLSQAVFVSELLRMVSRDPVSDRDRLLRGKRLKVADSDELQTTPLRNFFIQEQDDTIAYLVMEFFRAVEKRWPNAWHSREPGAMLPRTNGFRALMRIFKDSYIYLALHHNKDTGSTLDNKDFLGILQHSTLTDEEFTTETFVPGSTGENLLYKRLKNECEI